jgi:hypothetical protein
MNVDNILALDQIVCHDAGFWLATLPVPCRYGEFNLFAREPVLFRKKKDVGKDDVGYSREQTRGIPIPTSSLAVPQEWCNVRKQVQLWAWEVSSIVSAQPFAHHHSNSNLNQPLPKSFCLQLPQGRSRIISKQHGKNRDLVLDRTMRCHRCVHYTPKDPGRPVCFTMHCYSSSYCSTNSFPPL